MGYNPATQVQAASICSLINIACPQGNQYQPSHVNMRSRRRNLQSEGRFFLLDLFNPFTLHRPCSSRPLRLRSRCEMLRSPPIQVSIQRERAPAPIVLSAAVLSTFRPPHLRTFVAIVCPSSPRPCHLPQKFTTKKVENRRENGSFYELGSESIQPEPNAGLQRESFGGVTPG